MMKYGYDKSKLKGLGVKPFLDMENVRNKKIEEAGDSLAQAVFNSNILASKLHPDVQYCLVKEVIDRGNAKSFVLVPDKESGTESLSYFRAGQYISVALEFEGNAVCKPYSICSSPLDALCDDSSYMITVERNKTGFASDYILDNWKPDSKVMVSGPLGDFYWTGLRDSENVVAIAGGSGITPFYSMACAIADGIEDFSLTILYGNRCFDSILLRIELEQAALRSRGKVRIVNVLSDEMRPGCEHGFISSEIIRKYTDLEDCTILLCGPRAMYSYEDTQIPLLGLPRRRVRRDLFGEYGDPTGDSLYPVLAKGKTFKITVIMRDNETVISCPSEMTLLCAMEKAGVHAPSDCRSGQCGWCRSRLESGNVYVPSSMDGRRMADEKFGWIHPCCSYPLSDIRLEITELKA